MQHYELPDLKSLKQHLAQHYALYQVMPAETSAHAASQDTGWRKTEAGEHAALPMPRPLHSPKDFFFREQETLFVFDGECFRETTPAPPPFVLFGVTACDLHAIAYQDRFFAEDPHYQARRKQALLIGVDCLSPCENGFCPTVDAGPGVDHTTADLILHGSDNHTWTLIVCTDKGENAVRRLTLKPARSTAAAQRAAHIEESKRKFPPAETIHSGVDEINKNSVPDALWEAMGTQCLACSGCTTLCPTCSCFGTRDLEQENDGGVETQRFWDSCLYEAFQREASQHNPTEAAGARVKRFWYHKFSDDFRKDFGRYGCVGCGRCEQTCPGVIGVHAVMKRISEHAQTDAHGD